MRLKSVPNVTAWEKSGGDDGNGKRGKKRPLQFLSIKASRPDPGIDSNLNAGEKSSVLATSNAGSREEDS